MLNLGEEREKLKTIYASSATGRKAHGLIIAPKGAGKTTLCKTMPRPILIHSFDPGGCDVLRDEIASGDVIADVRFEDDDMMAPKAYLLWERTFNTYGKEGLFNSVGTYVLDSATTFANSMLWQIMAKEGHKPASMNVASDWKKHGMTQPDWGTFLSHWINIIRSMGRLPCHTFILGHIGKERDELNGGLLNTFTMPGQAKDQIPINLSEVWVLRTKAAPGGVKRSLQLLPDGTFNASTRMGSNGLFKLEEEPDVRALLKRAGYSWEDLKT